MLDSLGQPHRRTYQPNLDHAVTAEDAATAVAWMQHYLMTGPPVPAEPRYGPHGVEVDRAGDVESIETWWTASIDLDDTACWIPGQAPPSARAQLARVRYRSGIALNTAIQKCANADLTSEPIGDRWPDARGGLGACSGGATQLHNNRVTIISDPQDPSRARIVQQRKGAPVGFVLRLFTDPRFNHPGFAGVRVRLGQLKTPPEQVNACLKYRPAENRRLRTEVRGPVRVENGNTLELSRRSMNFLPADVSWDQVVSVWIDGIPDEEFVIGPIDRISGGSEPHR